LIFCSNRHPIFADPLQSRARERDPKWTVASGDRLRDRKGKVYQGSILEHILLQNLVQFFNVGEHNITRLESADWNDGLDMAFKRGERRCVHVFLRREPSGYRDLLEHGARVKGIKTVNILKEMLLLLDTLGWQVNYDKAANKRARLFNEYFPAVQPRVSGETVKVKVKHIVKDLRRKGHWIFQHIRTQEKITVEDSGEKFSWFNGYYDNEGTRVEGKKNDRVWMTLDRPSFSIDERAGDQRGCFRYCQGGPKIPIG